MRTPLALTAAAVALLALSACGAPGYTYVANTSDLTYFKVPAAWHKVDQRRLAESLTTADPDSETFQIEQKLTWSVAYDASKTPDPIDLSMIGGDQPIVLGLVRRLTTEQVNGVSLDVLRDLFHPVSDTGREQAEKDDRPLQDFELLHDQILTPGHGLRGVHEIYNYEAAPTGILQTFNLTAYLGDNGKVYALLLRCSAACYRQHTGELDAIADSFTVRSHL